MFFMTTPIPIAVTTAGMMNDHPPPLCFAMAKRNPPTRSRGMPMNNVGSILMNPARWPFPSLHVTRFVFMALNSPTLALRHGAPEALNMKPERDRAVA
jgi:hypothetical protein